MPPISLSLIAAAALLALWAAPARAYFGRTIYPCVEAMVGYADSVVVGRIEAVRSGDRRVEVVVEPLETLKGEKASEKIVVGVNEGQPWEECRSRGGECVLFRSKTGRKAFSFSDYQGAVMVDEKLGLYDLTRRHANTFDIRMQRLSDREEVLGAVKKAAAYERARGSPGLPEGYWPWASLPLRLDTPTGGIMIAGELLVPLDERLETVAEEWEKSADAELRVMAIRAANRLDTKRGRAILERLLDDPAYVVVPMEGWEPRLDWRERRVYWIRQAAWEGLAAKPRGKAPLLEGPHEGVYVRPAVWAWVLLCGAIVAVIALAAWTGRRRSWGAGMAVVSAALFAVVAWLAIRSSGRIEAVSFATGRSEHEIVSQHGRVGWLRVHDEPGRRGVRVRGETWGRPQAWFENYLGEETRKGWLGVTASSGKTATPGAGVAAYRYHLLGMRYSMLMGAFGVWPLVFLTIAGVKTLRRRLWTAMGRCRGCGYDVRWGAGKCPECGWENSSSQIRAMP